MLTLSCGGLVDSSDSLNDKDVADDPCCDSCTSDVWAGVLEEGVTLEVPKILMQTSLR